MGKPLEHFLKILTAVVNAKFASGFHEFLELFFGLGLRSLALRHGLSLSYQWPYR